MRKGVYILLECVADILHILCDLGSYRFHLTQYLLLDLAYKLLLFSFPFNLLNWLRLAALLFWRGTSQEK
jgi:hypothetical protein